MGIICPPLVEIGLTDLPKFEVSWHPRHPQGRHPFECPTWNSNLERNLDCSLTPNSLVGGWGKTNNTCLVFIFVHLPRTILVETKVPCRYVLNETIKRRKYIYIGIYLLFPQISITSERITDLRWKTGELSCAWFWCNYLLPFVFNVQGITFRENLSVMDLTIAGTIQTKKTVLQVMYFILM